MVQVVTSVHLLTKRLFGQRLEQNKALEILEDGKISLDNIYEFTIRYDDYPNLSQVNKIVYNSGEYIIKAFQVTDERKKEIVIMTTLGRLIDPTFFLITEFYENLMTEDNNFIVV
jgi:hypothetical protein